MSKQHQNLNAPDVEGLSDRERDAFDHSAKRSLINLDKIGNDEFTLLGFEMVEVLDDIILAAYIDLAAGHSGEIIRNGVVLPMGHLEKNKAWRMAQVLLAGPRCERVKVGDFICFPGDKGMATSNIKVKGIKGTVSDGIFINEQRIFGIVEPENLKQAKKES